MFSTIGDERATSDDLKRQLHLVGEVFANLLARKVAEVELQKLREDLGHVNRVATIGELTTSLAHELNQPLTAILSCAQAAQRLIDVDPVDRGEFREILTEIVEDGRRAAAVIDRLRALLKKGDPQLTILDLNETVAEVARLIRSDALVRDISIRLELDPRSLRCGATECSCSRCSSIWPSTGWTRCRSCARVSGPSSSGQPGIARAPSGSRFETPGSESAGATWSTCFRRSTRPRLAGWGSD